MRIGAFILTILGINSKHVPIFNMFSKVALWTQLSRQMLLDKTRIDWYVFADLLPQVGSGEVPRTCIQGIIAAASSASMTTAFST